MRYTSRIAVFFVLALVASAAGQIAEEEAPKFGVRFGEPEPIH